MRPITPVKANPGVHSTPIRHASGSSQVIKPSLEITSIRRRQPVFSDVSSDTEYSSSSGEDDAHENGNCVESKPKDEPRSQDEHIRASTSAALPSISHVKMENLQQGSPFGISSPTGGVAPGGVVNGQTASARPSISIPKVAIKPTPLKERHEVLDGKTIVVFDLDDSDEEETSPLCTKCRHGMEHKQPELQVSKVQNCPSPQFFQANCLIVQKTSLKHIQCLPYRSLSLFHPFLFSCFAWNVCPVQIR